MQAIAPPPPQGGAAERRLRDMVQRAAGRDGIALVLHLARLAPLPHHRRVARAMLQDAAERHEGQFFALRNGDMLVSGRGDALAAAGLPATLARLLQQGIADPEAIVSVWRLPQDRALMLAYADARLADGMDPPNETDVPASVAGVCGLAAFYAPGTESHAATDDMLQLQTAVRLATSPSGGRGLRPIHRAVRLCLAALAAQSGSAADPFLLRHLDERLGERMLARLGDELGRGGVLDAAASLPLQVKLAPAGVLSEAFDRFAAACGMQGVRPGVAMDLLEAAADPEGFRAASLRLAACGMTLALDGVSHAALTLIRPETLAPGRLMLDWSPPMGGLPEPKRQALDAAIAAFGADRIVLQQADLEAALRWGLARGISRFQGRHADAIQAAARMLACPARQACSLGQCVARAGAAGPAGRAGCRNRTLLDAGLPGSGLPGSGLLSYGILGSGLAA